LAVTKNYLDCILAKPGTALRDAKSAVPTIILLLTYQTWFLCIIYHAV